MNPRDEFNDLVSRSRRLLSAMALFLITFALLIVALGTLFCATWISCFVFWTGLIDRISARVTTWKPSSKGLLDAESN